MQIDDSIFDDWNLDDVTQSVKDIKNPDKKLYVDNYYNDDGYEKEKSNNLLEEIADKNYSSKKTPQRKRKTKNRNPDNGIYSKFTISLNITQVKELNEYAKNNDIKISELIRNLLYDNQIISKLDDIQTQSSNEKQIQQEKDSLINSYFKKA